MNTCGRFLVLFVMWVILSGHTDAFFLISGAISSVATILISRRMLGVLPSECYKCMPVRTVGLLRLAGNISKYVIWLLWQVVLSAVYVTRNVFCSATGDISVSPRLVVMAMKQNSGLGAFMLTSSVTLTPGTVGMKTIVGSKVKVLALDDSLVPGVADMDARIERVFEE